MGTPSIGDIFHKVKLDFCPGQKILNDIETIIWKLSV
jgi:hypothetical protein